MKIPICLLAICLVMGSWANYPVSAAQKPRQGQDLAIAGLWAGYQTLKRVCSCESTGYSDREPVQFGADGSPLRGHVDPDDVGGCQINEPTWKVKAKELGYDIEANLAANVSMAKWIADNDSRHYGNWKASRGCWKKEKTK